MARIDALRAAAAAVAAGRSAEEFARVECISVREASRLFSAVHQGEGIGDVRPLEIILRAWVEGSARGQLLEHLAAYPFSFGVSAPYPHDGYSPGTWDEVRLAATMGYLAEEELKYLAENLDR